MLSNTVIQNYLNHFGYQPTEAGLAEAQSVLDIPGASVEITEKRFLLTPRCGLSDCTQSLGSNLNQWDKQKALGGLKAYIKRGVDGINIITQKELMVKAFQAWETHSQLEMWIVNTIDEADIIVDASASRAEQFGQAGNVLAWAQLPQGPRWVNQLLMKYDLAERWTMDMFLATSTHEDGHLFGLDHTQMSGNLMLPTLDLRIITPQMGYDIPQIQLRYDKPVVIRPTPNVPNNNPFKDTIIVDKGLKYKIVPV